MHRDTFMKTELQIVWRGVEPSTALAERIQHHVDELETTAQDVRACRVVIEAPHHHHRHGEHWAVKVELSSGAHFFAVTRDPPQHTNSEDAYAAVNEAFATLGRQLHEQGARRRAVARHERHTRA